MTEPAQCSVTEYLESLEVLNMSTLSEEDNSCSVCLQEFHEAPQCYSLFLESVEAAEALGGFVELPFALMAPAHTPVRTECKHVFGKSCLAEWLEVGSTCPYCRTDIGTQAWIRQRRDWALRLTTKNIREWRWDELKITSHGIVIFPTWMETVFRKVLFVELTRWGNPPAQVPFERLRVTIPDILRSVLNENAYLPIAAKYTEPWEECRRTMREVLARYGRRYGCVPFEVERAVQSAIEFTFKSLSVAQAVYPLNRFVRLEQADDSEMNEGLMRLIEKMPPDSYCDPGALKLHPGERLAMDFQYASDEFVEASRLLQEIRYSAVAFPDHRMFMKIIEPFLKNKRDAHKRLLNVTRKFCGEAVLEAVAYSEDNFEGCLTYLSDLVYGDDEE
ncbi:hypothetical protein BS50DRAFT_580937 [Corynespora cassiicola Philippines]|uniref:RING-type domain-containing protein n=1 Tax=Corynespora cassiicola Philippines TaxID=1448308 RepID=A0A2T2P8W7_CORCC|nr:hypothetical protein BS50DRAFT_580937 [Corynespora cassiicola Philippines]